MVSDDSGVRFRKSNFTVFVDTRDLANVDFAKASNEEYNGGSVNTYPKFLFWPGKDWEEAFIDLGAVFNQQAINKNARMHFSITIPIEIKDKCQVYLNGKEVGDPFDINSDNSKLSIRISHDAPEAGYTILMEGKGVNIESVNAELGDKYILELKVKHTTSWNPLKTILFWVAIIIVFLTLLMYVWRNILTRKIMDKQICLSPDYYNPIAEVSNCIKCILTNKKKTGRNGLIHRIYCGPIQYVNIPEAMSDIVLVTNYDDDIIVKANISYDIDDIPLTSNRNIQLNSKTEFVLRDKNASFTIIIS